MADLKQMRTTRNIEHSIQDFLVKELEENDWKDVNVIFRNQRTNKTRLPAIAIKVSATTHNRVEFSSSSTYRTFIIILDLYCQSEIQQEDLKDTIISVAKESFPYNQYEIHSDENTNAKEISSHRKGRVSVLTIEEEEIDFNVPLSQLPVADRYRHRITLNCMLGIVEAKGDISA
jgi:hypothetical protein